MAVEDHTSAYLAFNIFLHNVSEYTDVNQVAFDFPTYTQLRCPTTGIPWGSLLHRHEPAKSRIQTQRGIKLLPHQSA